MTDQTDLWMLCLQEAGRIFRRVDNTLMVRRQWTLNSEHYIAAHTNLRTASSTARRYLPATVSTSSKETSSISRPFAFRFLSTFICSIAGYTSHNGYADAAIGRRQPRGKAGEGKAEKSGFCGNTRIPAALHLSCLRSKRIQTGSKMEIL
jgi:hypothetical protein